MVSIPWAAKASRPAFKGANWEAASGATCSSWASNARAVASEVSATGTPKAAAAWNSISFPCVKLSSWDLVASSWALEPFKVCSFSASS